MHRRTLLAAVGAGLLVGAVSAVGRFYLDGTLDALVNSISTWLVAPFAVGALATTRRGACLAGLLTCACQLGGYYVVAYPLGFETTTTLVAFWSLCGVLGGPAFAIAGQAWRSGASGLGMAALAGSFIAEGLYAYLHQLHDYATGVIWIGVGIALALLPSGARSRQLRGLGLMVPLGLSGEIVLTEALHRVF